MEKSLGKRGELYVVIQFALAFLVIFGPRTLNGHPSWAEGTISEISTIAGLIFLLFGGFLSVSGLFKLGHNLTPLPLPKENSTLVETGPYSLVRHPIYSGIIFCSFGWALLVHGYLTIIYSIIFFIFFDIKSRFEEKMLSKKFSDYQSYQKKVRKLIPFIY
ncbi:MAG: isoprenylcysteine carboxylmethyltransferase family protein [Bacteroidota bacterium]|nr:isoprenylcysteine carboxylmethyltransferase family protein [Bacteroidota bacterium]MDP4192034.1 isoprenylcysteine carboxylmethyltransferase family protein [Bacteroidota bacterium]MDP4196504.1 isoprenylcysteine carboxylmethyltransferase family protein [Bacteroidota bacterium]